jgi:hypothetical protein
MLPVHAVQERLADLSVGGSSGSFELLVNNNNDNNECV